MNGADEGIVKSFWKKIQHLQNKQSIQVLEINIIFPKFSVLQRSTLCYSILRKPRQSREQGVSASGAADAGDGPVSLPVIPTQPLATTVQSGIIRPQAAGNAGRREQVGLASQIKSRSRLALKIHRRHVLPACVTVRVPHLPQQINC